MRKLNQIEEARLYKEGKYVKPLPDHIFSGSWWFPGANLHGTMAAMSSFHKRPAAGSTASEPALDTVHAENATLEVDPAEAPATLATIYMCAFAAVGGMFYGYDTGYVNGIIGMKYFIHAFTGLPYPPETPEELFTVPSSRKSLIVSILSAGTFVGACTCFTARSIHISH